MDKIVSDLAEKFVFFNVIDQSDIAIYRYGLEVFLLSLLESISVLVISLMIGNFLETIVYFIVLIPIRMFAGGYHASTRLRCYLLSLVVYGIFTILVKYFPTSVRLEAGVIIVFFSLAIIFLFTSSIKSNRFSNKEEISFFEKISRKILIVDSLIIALCCFFKIETILFVIALGLLSEVIALLAVQIFNHN